MKKITSHQNILIKHLVKLRQSRKYREACQTAVASGKKLVEEIGRELKPKVILHSPDIQKIPSSDSPYCVPIDIIKKVTGLPAPEGIVAEFPLPPPSSLQGKRSLLVLDQLSDPGNVGTLIRTALALGWEGVFLLSGSVDVFNDKAIRASKGGSFLLPYCYGTREDLISLIRHNHHTPILANLKGEPLEKEPPPKNPLLILGSEAHGISEAVKTLGKNIKIALTPQMESLNVAVAGGILMYALRAKP